MKGVTSFCVFGSDPHGIYFDGALINADLYAEHYPDVTCLFYLSDSAYVNISEELEQRSNCRVVHVKGHREDQSFTFQRFLALREVGYDYYLFRDVDSRPIRREREAVEEWLASDKNFHVMRDHIRHGVPVLAGLWGATAEGARQIRKKVPNSIHGNHYGVDQDWIVTHLWRTMRWSLMAHVSRPEHSFKNEITEFKTPIWDEGFVGEGYYGDGSQRFPDHRLEVLPGVQVQKPA